MPETETKLALLEQQISYLVTGFNDFREEFKAWQKSMSNEYVPRSELELEFRSIKDELKSIKEDRKTARSTIISWVSVGISAMSTIVAVIAVIKKF